MLLGGEGCGGEKGEGVLGNDLGIGWGGAQVLTEGCCGRCLGVGARLFESWLGTAWS